MGLSKKSKILLGSFLGLLSLNEFKAYYKQIKEVKLMEERLLLPIYELSEEELINPPWTENFDDWKFRRVKITGRYKHRFSMYITDKIHDYEGYQFILPMVTSEDENYENQRGILINKGWLPHERKELGNRGGLEDSFTKQSVIGIVTKGEPFTSSRFLRRGNVVDQQRFIFNSIDLQEMAKASQLVNTDQASKAVIRLITKDWDRYDKNSPHFYD